ncbi:MAG: molybdopterin-synthase adenylyltransferase [Thermotogota bacterium]|nr:molybdopterin-synthase adenylyltransferase [Thermotogota bacterium]MDK2864619.1 molybdopterin-synthase adenylyltransferase [Thermotogota bacterium]HCZ06080.1 adenylyltransferase [Thermotogota bacterium]
MLRPLELEKVWERQVPLISSDCQKRLRNARVAVVGAGGLGSPVSIYLARSGVGKLLLIDRGKVDLPDLHRQILYTPDDLGRAKVEVAKEKLEKECPWTELEALEISLDDSFDFPDVDLVVSCLDNFATRYLLDEITWKKGLPVVHGAVEAYTGQITTIVPGVTPRLKEIIPGFKDPERKILVLPPAVAVVASLQTLEAVKYLCDMPGNLVNRLLVIDLLNYSIEIAEIKRKG